MGRSERAAARLIAPSPPLPISPSLFHPPAFILISRADVQNFGRAVKNLERPALRYVSKSGFVCKIRRPASGISVAFPALNAPNFLPTECAPGLCRAPSPREQRVMALERPPTRAPSSGARAATKKFSPPRLRRRANMRERKSSVKFFAPLFAAALCLALSATTSAQSTANLQGTVGRHRHHPPPRAGDPLKRPPLR